MRATTRQSRVAWERRGRCGIDGDQARISKLVFDPRVSFSPSASSPPSSPSSGPAPPPPGRTSSRRGSRQPKTTAAAATRRSRTPARLISMRSGSRRCVTWTCSMREHSAIAACPCGRSSPAYRPPATADLALLHFRNGMIVPLAFRDEKLMGRLDPFVALSISRKKQQVRDALPQPGPAGGGLRRRALDRLCRQQGGGQRPLPPGGPGRGAAGVLAVDAGRLAGRGRVRGRRRRITGSSIPTRRPAPGSSSSPRAASSATASTRPGPASAGTSPSRSRPTRSSPPRSGSSITSNIAPPTRPAAR